MKRRAKDAHVVLRVSSKATASLSTWSCLWRRRPRYGAVTRASQTSTRISSGCLGWGRRSQRSTTRGTVAMCVLHSLVRTVTMRDTSLPDVAGGAHVRVGRFFLGNVYSRVGDGL